MFVSSCGGSSDSSSPVSELNQKPFVDAGQQQTVESSSIVYLKASATDSDGSIASLLWKQIDGPAVVLNDSASEEASFTAPAVSADESLTFEIIATDDKGATASDEVIISVTPPHSSSKVSILTADEVSAGSTIYAEVIPLENKTIASIKWSSSPKVTIVPREQNQKSAQINIPSDIQQSEVIVHVEALFDDGGVGTTSTEVNISEAITFIDFSGEFDEPTLSDITITPTVSEDSELTPANRNEHGYETLIASPQTGLIFSPSPGHLTLESGDISTIQVGDVIVGVTDSGEAGFLRQVQSLNGNILATTRARFTDAFPDAELSINLTVSNSSTRTRADIVSNGSKTSYKSKTDLLSFNRVIQHEFTPEITSVVELKMNSAVEIDFDISVLKRQIERIATIANADYQTKAHIALDYDFEKELFDKSQSFNPIVDNSTVVYVSGIPILFNVKLIPQLEAKVGVAGAINAKFGVATTGEYETGFDYYNDNLDIINQFKPTISSIGPTYDLSAEASARAEAEIQVVLSVYETTIPIPFSDGIIIDGPGIGLEMGPFATFTAKSELDVVKEQIECLLDLTLGFNVDANFDYGIVGDILGMSESRKKESVDIYDFGEPVWQKTDCPFATEFSSIHGTVTDPEGLPLSNASIQLLGSATGTLRNTITSNSGQFNLSGVSEGSYSLSATKSGYAPESLPIEIEKADREVNLVLLTPINEDDLSPQPLIDSQGNLTKTARVTGDPNLRTFDGLSYGFHGVGEYILAKSSLDSLEIQGRYEAVERSQSVSLNAAIAADVEGNRLAFYRGNTGLALLIEGELSDISFGTHQLSNGAAIERKEREFIVFWADGSSMRVFRRGDFVEVETALNNQRAGSVNGLLGRFDGSIENELQSSTGQNISNSNFNELYDIYGESWRVTEESTLFDYFDNESVEGFINRNYPRSLMTKERLIEQVGITEYQRILELCSQYVQQQSRLNACVLDVALTGQESGLTSYQQIAESTRELILPIPPLVNITSPSGGEILSSNVIIEGQFDTPSVVSDLKVSINNGALKTIPLALSDSSFKFSLSPVEFIEGTNTITIFVTDTDGNTGNATTGFIFDKDAAPSPGGDLIVINDVNVFDDDRIWRADNIQFVKNLANFSDSSERSSETTIMWDRSHDSRCDNTCGNNSFSRMISELENEGFNIEQNYEKSGIETVKPNVKLIILWTPQENYSVNEIVSLKKFASEGGRIVYVGENDKYMLSTGIQHQNDFLISMGASMRNIGEAVYGGNTYFNISESNEHQIVHSVNQIVVNYVSLLSLGPNDYPLITSDDGSDVIAGVAVIDINKQTKVSRKAKANISRLPRYPNPPSPIAERGSAKQG
ncbi:hypothetical protein GCM10011369_21680 [Neiella marina]|uniref:VWFD domain-containing protein n=1 Tax=Neiella marina TaxID=508461 RepID=A0A8J2U5N2_9GAMM|nr:hypothetical protein GCM10011369_21680 [Neiella marina]